jgi:ribosomal-protein-serine acetyltransferase
MEKNIRLSAGGILLRPYYPDDASKVYDAARESFPEVHRWLPWCHGDYSMQESEKWIESCDAAWDKGSAYEFAIFELENGGYLGGCGLNHIDPIYKMANLGYWVRSSRVRQDIATTAAILLARSCFVKLQLNRIEIVAATGNTASQRVAEKAGAKREGVLRNRISVNGLVHDAVMFSIIPQDLH